jgi:hypothetical protein
MESITNEYGTRVLYPAEGKRIALAGAPESPYGGKIYLGCNDSPDRYVEVDAPPEPETENGVTE